MSQKRHELKYSPGLVTYQQSLAIIRQHPASFVRTYPDRIINNIYFDNAAYDAYRETVAGVSHRRKHRIRWYGDEWSTIRHPKLEIKIKENLIGHKVSHTLQDFVMANLINQIHAIKKDGTLPAPLLPVSSNSYLRSYFATWDGRFRITIDRNLAYGAQTDLGKQPLQRVSTIILELKYNVEYHQDADWIRQFLPFRRTRFSKYVEGLQVCGSGR